jgi:hypothetical protein
MSTETEQFICAVLTGCARRSYDPVSFLSVRMFETGSTLSAWYETDLKLGKKRKYQSFGLLQYTVEGIEPLTFHRSKAEKEALFLQIRQLNRLEQLEICFQYMDYWSSNGVDVSFADQDLYHYVKTLAPTGGPDYPQDENLTPRQITQGSGAAGKNFRAIKRVVEGMLNGTHPVPNDAPTREKFNQKGSAAYRKKWGSQLVNPNTCGLKVPEPKKVAPAEAVKPQNEAQPGVKNTPVATGIAEKAQSVTQGVPKTAKSAATKAKKALEDLLPLKISFTIPMYPRLVQLKPGDVIVLPSEAVYRDWLVTSISIEFNQGLNTLKIQGNRPLEAKAFVQNALLGFKPNDVMSYYWLT